jgi:hypothetical protein
MRLDAEKTVSVAGMKLRDRKLGLFRPYVQTPGLIKQARAYYKPNFI